MESARMGPNTPRATRIGEEILSIIRGEDYPCVGAKTAVRRGSYRVRQYSWLDSNQSAQNTLAKDLASFVAANSVPRSAFTVVIAVDDSRQVEDEEDFEGYVWSCLQGIHENDDCDWDSRYSANPADPTFKFSCGGRAFYVVGLNPASRHRARRFPYPTLIFNPVWQFERLRDLNQLDNLITVTRERDTAYSGSMNPNLKYEGIFSDALQYSGCSVDEQWVCPFRA